MLRQKAATKTVAVTIARTRNNGAATVAGRTGVVIAATKVAAVTVPSVANVMIVEVIATSATSHSRPSASRRSPRARKSRSIRIHLSQSSLLSKSR